MYLCQAVILSLTHPFSCLLFQERLILPALITLMSGFNHLQCFITLLIQTTRIDPVLHDFIMQNDDRKPPPVSGILSPWDAFLRSAGWDPEGAHNSDDDDFTVTYVSGLNLMKVVAQHRMH